MEQKLNGITQKVAQYANKYGEIVGVGGTDASSWTAKLALKWLLMKTFWLVLFVIFSVLTVQSGAALVERFIAADTISVLTIVNDQPFAVPKGTVCLPIYGFTLDELFQKGNGTVAAVKEYFSQQGLTKEKLLVNGGRLPWPRTLLDYFTTITLSEGGLWWQGTFAFSSNYSTMNKLDENEYRNDTWIGYFNNYMLREYLNEDSWSAQFHMESYLDQLGVTTEEMKQALGRELIRAFSLTASHYTLRNGKTSFRQINSFKLAYATWYLTCFDIDFPSENVSLTSAKEFIYVQMDPSPTLSTRMNGINYTGYMLYDVLGRFGTEMQQNTLEIDNTDNNIYTELGWNKTFGVSVQATYRAMPIVSRQKKCTEGELIDTREWNCRVERIQKQCNCTPVMLPLLSTAKILATKGDCSLAKLSDCLSYEGGSDSTCRKKLLPDCENRKLEIPKPTDARNIGHGQLARITIKVKDFTSRIFAEQYVWTYDDFISALGGVLGLWLGLDFLIIIQVTITALSFMFKIGMATWRADSHVSG